MLSKSLTLRTQIKGKGFNSLLFSSFYNSILKKYVKRKRKLRFKFSRTWKKFFRVFRLRYFKRKRFFRRKRNIFLKRTRIFIRKKTIFRHFFYSRFKDFMSRIKMFEIKSSFRYRNFKFWRLFLRRSKRKFLDLDYLKFLVQGSKFISYIANYNGNLKMTYEQKLAYLDKTSLSRVEKLKLLRRA